MSDPEHFLSRWSRRKRAADEAAEETKPATPEEMKHAPELPSPPVAAEERTDAISAAHGPPSASGAAPPAPAFDITQLPSLDQITAETDIRAFLKPGVPPELTRAALRRVWTADSQIRDFVGLAENAWDFTAEGGAPGFGPLEMTDELRQIVSDIVGRNLKSVEPEPPAPTAQVVPRIASLESSVETAAQEPGAPTANEEHLEAAQDETANNQGISRSCDEKMRVEQENIATQQSSRKTENQPAIVSRTHGRALPK